MTRARGHAAVALLVGLVVVSVATAPRADAQPRDDRRVAIQTLPVVPGVTIELDGQASRTDEQGVAQFDADWSPDLNERLEVIDDSVALADGVRARFARFYGLTGSRLIATFDIDYLVTFTFRDMQDNAVDAGDVDSVVLKSSVGAVEELPPTEPVWLHGSRVVSLTGGLEVKDFSWTVQDVQVDGASVVNRAQQKFTPKFDQTFSVQLLFYTARFKTRDALFGFPVGSEIVIEHPNGRIERRDVGDGGEVVVSGLPRGDYEVAVDGPGLHIARPVSISRDQDVDLKLYTWLDLGVVALAIGAFAGGLLLVGRRSRRRRRRSLEGDARTPVVAAPAVEP